VEANRSRDTVNVSIDEEKYLINMYLTVIEEIKSQLKIEQAQKIDLIRRLVVIKNTEKMCMEKYLSKEAISDQIYRGMNESMKKWI
jgi:adenylate cyclase